MKGVSTRTAMPAVTARLAVMLAGSTRANDTSTISNQEVQAKLQYCEVCHGVTAQGFLGYYPIPRLAGQQVAYMEDQLKGFSEHKRTNNIMFNVGHVLSPAMITALANNFHDLNPKTLSIASMELVATGNQIYE